MSEKAPFPSNFGRITFEGIPASRFWVKALDLEDEVSFVQAEVAKKKKTSMAAMPIIGEYEVDENFQFCFVLQLSIDTLGIQHGIGMVIYSDKEHLAEALKRRDHLGDEMLEELKKRQFEEGIQMRIVPPRKQS